MKGWLKEKLGLTPEQQAHKKTLQQIRRDARMKGEMAGARRAGFKEGYRSQAAAKKSTAEKVGKLGSFLMGSDGEKLSDFLLGPAPKKRKKK